MSSVTATKRDPGQRISLLGRQLELWQGLFYLLLLYAFLILTTFPKYGVNPDEAGHIDYGESVYVWYETLFQERGIFTRANIWLYGGFYDALVHLVTLVSPLGLHDTRHLCNALVGLIGVVGAYKLGGLLGNRWVGFAAALFLVLTPRYYGHAFFNHKDIPFAVAFLWSTYYILQGVGHLPQLPRALIWKTGLALGLSLGIRVGGFVLVGYLGLFYALRYFQLVHQQQARRDAAVYLPLIKRYLLQVISIATIAYCIMLAFWPWAQLDPLVRPLQAFLRFSQFPYDIATFFEGAYVNSTQIPWYYAPKWLLITLPEFLLLGLFGGAVFAVVARLKGWEGADRLLALQRGLLAFGAFFPIAMVVLTQAPLCNGIRHLLFAVVLLAVLCAVRVGYVVSRVPKIRWPAGIAMGALLTLTLWDMVGLHPNEYVYFNRLFGGGTTRASALYETDYYHHSYTQGIRWVKNYFEQHPPPRKVRIAGVSQHVWYMFDSDLYEYPSAPWEADLYLVTTHFDAHRNVPGKVLHTVRANGAELLYIIHPDNNYSDHALFAVPPNSHRYFQLAALHQGAGQTDKALAAYGKGLESDPNNDHAYNRIGDAYLKRKEYEKALKNYKIATELKPTIAEYHAKTATVYHELEQYQKAL